jgi:predicted amidohydrolase YtcJ
LPPDSHRVLVNFGVVAALALSGCGQKTSDTATPVANANWAETIYQSGDILTMAGDAPKYVEAVAVKNGKIVFVGSKADADKLKGPSTAVTDLQGKTLLPGMIDTHVHWGKFVLLSALDRVNPAEVRSVDAYLVHLNQVSAKTSEGEWVINYGFEKLMIPPFRNLSREDLDRVSTKHPVFWLYNNFHWATANTAALEKLRITKDSPTSMPGGGIVVKDKKGMPTGLLTESAVYVIGPVIAAQVSPDKQATLPFEIGAQPSANGLTTVADLSSGSSDGLKEIQALQKVANDDRFPLRLSATVMYEVLPQMTGPIAWDGKFQATRCKLLMDASLAGGTAATVKPMLNKSTATLNYTPEQFQEAIQRCMDKGFTGATHVMGDRAHKMMLQAFENVSSKYDYSKTRNVIEHSALIDPADLTQVKKLNLYVGVLSPFLHAYGDPLRDMVFGESVAGRLFAVSEYDKLGINTAHHSDGPIVEARPLYLVWSAVNRTTVSGKVLSADLKQAPYAGLLGVTRNAARHLGLDSEIGSLSVGKLADFAILTDNPVKVDPMKIRDITVLETSKAAGPTTRSRRRPAGRVRQLADVTNASAFGGAQCPGWVARGSSGISDVRVMRTCPTIRPVQGDGYNHASFRCLRDRLNAQHVNTSTE